MSKSRDAFRTISEVSELLDTPAHVLRFWESKFSQVKPVKRAGGRRYYRPADLELLAGIKQLLHDDGMTIKGAQKTLREQGVKHVVAIGSANLKSAQSTAATDVIDVTPTPAADPKPQPTPDVAATPVAEADIVEAEPEAEVAITNVVPLPPANTGPALSLDLSAKPDSAPTPDLAAAVNVPADPADNDSKAPARVFHLLQKAPHDRLAKRAAAITPLLARMQTLRNSISQR